MAVKKKTTKKVTPTKKKVTKTTVAKKSTKKKVVKRRRTTNYLNNRDLLAQTIESLEQGKMTDKLAHMLMMLVQRYGKKGNFAGYTYNDDMQAYALMMLVRTWKSFKPWKSTNAFAFFTQCVKNSFIQFLNQERRQRDIRDEMLVTKGMNPSHTFMTAHEQKMKDRKFAPDEEDFDSQYKKNKTVEDNKKLKDNLLTF